MRKNFWDISKGVRGRLLGCVLAFGTAVAGVCAQPKDTPVQARIDTASIRIGEAVAYTLKVETEKTDTVSLPDEAEIKKSVQTGGIEVLGIEKADTSLRRQRAEYVQKMTLTAFDSGAYVINPIEVKINGESHFTRPFTLSVSTVEVDTLKQPRYGIADIYGVPYTFSEIIKKFWWVVPALILIAGVIWLVLWLVKRSRREKIDPEMLLSPYERARHRLERLDEEQLWQNGMVKEYYIRLTDVIRNFLSEQYDIPAPEQTSRQTLRAVAPLELSREMLEDLRGLLEDSDLVKFAKVQPSEYDNQRYRKIVAQILEALRPQEPSDDQDQQAKDDAE